MLSTDTLQSRLSAIVLTVVTFAVALYFYTRNNDFAFYYHPDEPRKVEQILLKERNFHHPLLMLMVTDRAIKVGRELWDMERTARRIVVVGRWVSAVFAAIAVAALVFLVARTQGLLAGAATGICLGTLPDLYHYAHFFKEDPALTMGMSLSVAGAAWFFRRPSAWSLAGFAVGCGLAASSKYVGVLAFVFALPAVVWRLKTMGGTGGVGEGTRPWLTPGRGTVAFVGVFLVMVAVCNYRIFSMGEGFGPGVSREWHGVVEGHQGMKSFDAPHAHYLTWMKVMVPGWCWWLVAVAVIAPAVFRSLRRYLPERLYTFALCAGYVMALSMTTKISNRYFLPFLFLVAFLTVLGAFDLASLVRGRLREGSRWRFAPHAVVAVVLIIFLGHENLFDRSPWDPPGPAGRSRGTLDYAAQFEGNSYGLLKEWILENLDESAVIYQGKWSYYPTPDLSRFRRMEVPPELPQRVIGEMLQTGGTLGTLRDAGVTHIVVAQGGYSRYLGDAPEGDPEVLAEFADRARFYKEMVEKCEQVWARPVGIVGPLNPGLELWEMPGEGE